MCGSRGGDSSQLDSVSDGARWTGERTLPATTTQHQPALRPAQTQLTAAPDAHLKGLTHIRGQTTISNSRQLHDNNTGHSSSTGPRCYAHWLQYMAS